MENIDLNTLRDALLHLHKLLLEFQRRQYTESYRKNPKPGEMYALAVSHEDFQWLRSLSSVIVAIDEALADDEKQIDTKDLIGYIKKLIAPNESGNEFSRRYHEVLQSYPEALVAHGKIVQLLSLNK